MARVAAVRRWLGVRTIFNLLGPLANPAGVKRQLIGVPASRWVKPIAEALARLGGDQAMVVHGSDGLDEITVTGPSSIARLQNGLTEISTVTPADAGLAVHDEAGLIGGDPGHNAGALRRLLDGSAGAYRDIVLINSAAALMVAERATNWADGAAMAAVAIDSGEAKDLLARWAAFR